MISTCPNCLEQIKHDDGIFEVTCSSCQSKFNPFLSPSDIPSSLDNLGLGDTGSGNAPADNGTDSSVSSLGSDPGLGQESIASDFSESNAMFAELRDFGENLLGEAPAAPVMSDLTMTGEPVPTAEESAEAEQGNRAKPKARPAAPPPLTSGDELFLTSGESLPGFQIEMLLSPVSLWSDLTGTDEDPLAKAFADVSERARQAGGNAILGLRWALNADSTRVLVSGTPARVSPK